MKKSVKNFRFKRVFKGYDPQEVEAYLTVEQSKASDVQSEQRERINQLKAQCSSLYAELAVLRGREEQIKGALVSATEKADKMTLDIKLRYASELDRLKLFRAKWINAYDEIKERYHFSKDALNMESVAISTELEIKKFLSQDFSLDRGDPLDEMEAHFKDEADRLSAPETKVLELKQKLIEAAEKKHNGADKVNVPNAAFSFDEALNPKESLEEICKSLGLK